MIRKTIFKKITEQNFEKNCDGETDSLYFLKIYISGDGCKAMSFPNLRSFSLQSSRFVVEDDFIFNIVKQCPMLEKFGIFGKYAIYSRMHYANTDIITLFSDFESNLSSITYRCLGDLKNLMDLEIQFNVAEPINNEDFEYIAAKCTKLKYISFGWPVLNLHPSELIKYVTNFSFFVLFY